MRVLFSLYLITWLVPDFAIAADKAAFCITAFSLVSEHNNIDEAYSQMRDLRWRLRLDTAAKPSTSPIEAKNGETRKLRNLAERIQGIHLQKMAPEGHQGSSLKGFTIQGRGQIDAFLSHWLDLAHGIHDPESASLLKVFGSIFDSNNGKAQLIMLQKVKAMLDGGKKDDWLYYGWNHVLNERDLKKVGLGDAQQKREFYGDLIFSRDQKTGEPSISLIVRNSEKPIEFRQGRSNEPLRELVPLPSEAPRRIE